MVLARKKLKQKLHALLTAGVTAAEAHGEAAAAVKERLIASKRPRPKRERRTKQESKPKKKSIPEMVRQTEEGFRKEVERRREERRKEKKEKRRIRRLIEAENDAAASAGQVEGETGVEMEGKKEADSASRSESHQTVEAMDRQQSHVVEMAKTVVRSDNPTVAEHGEQSIKKVYVGGIPYYSSEDDIRSFFEACGSIAMIDCMTFPESGKFRGIAILTFKTAAAAQRALAMDGADMGGFYLKIQPYKHNREKEDFAPTLIEGYNRIYIGNLPWDITDDDLQKFFSECKISSIRFGTDKETGEFKGYAHVDFSDGTSLAAALKLDQKVINGRPVRIRCAVPKKDNQNVNDNGNSDQLKSKIRTCYECGTPGHFSSSCPNKEDCDAIPDEMEADANSAIAVSKKRRTCYEYDIPNKKDSEIVSDEKKSKKRRTCYDCGTPGHLSSASPNKRTSDFVPNDIGPVGETKVGDKSNSSASKKTRKCYECGISGHLSSACPNKEEEMPDNHSNTLPSVIADENNAGEDKKSVPAKKKKRRKCYECGITGHLSSECPNKAAVDVK